MPAAYGLRQQNSWRLRQTYSSAKRRQSSGPSGRRQAPFPSLWQRSTIPSSKASFQAWRIRAVTSLASCSSISMVGKWLEMLKEVAPGVARAALMFNPDTSPYYYLYLRSFEAVPRSVAVEVTAAPVRDIAEVENAIAKLGRQPGGGLIVPPDAFNLVHYPLVIRLAQQ